MFRLFTVLFLSLFVISCAQNQDLPEPEEDVPVYNRLTATISPTEGNDVSGVVTFTREGEDVRVTATISGLEEENLQGFHVHEYGDCSAGDATSAGGHFNPYGMDHGAPTDSERHVGDMGNISSDSDGVATLDYLDPVLELDGSFSIIGRGVVVHAGEDDFQTQPTGDAGSRLGCGVIGIAQPDGNE